MKNIIRSLFNRKKWYTGILISLFSFSFLHGQFTQPNPQKRPLPGIEFLGYDYSKYGYTLSSGEKLSLRFRNNTGKDHSFPMKWELKTFEGKFLIRGESELMLKPGHTGEVPVSLPEGLKDGHYNIFYSLKADGWQGIHPFHFDYRVAEPNENLNLNLVAFIENMDTEGWLRMMLGPFAKFCNIWNEFPEDMSKVDAAIVIAEALDFFNPRFARLQEYVRTGGTILVFGRTAPVLSVMLPVNGSSEMIEKNKPLYIKTSQDSLWKEFSPGNTLLHYPVPVTVKAGASILAEWSDGSPAVVSGKYGQGKVIYIGAGTLQVWQKNPSLIGADEMALRLLYYSKAGSEGVREMIRYASDLYINNKKTETAIRDRVLEGVKVKKPEEFLVISKNNIGRFGWVNFEGSLTENLMKNALVSPVHSKDQYRLIPDPTFEFTFSVKKDLKPEYTGVRHNWFAKTTEWTYSSGEKVVSTISLGTPAILWEGTSKEISLAGTHFTHVAFPVKSGIKIAGPGETINTAELSENWLLAFMAADSIRDMPQLIVLTRRPALIALKEGLQFEFPSGGFGAIFTSRLYGIKRFSPGSTKTWIKTIPHETIDDARRWSRTFLSFPADCDEISWIENNIVKTADKIIFRNFKTDWKTTPLTIAIIPPVYILAKNVGTPVQLPDGLSDLKCPTKYGPMMGVKGSSTLISVPVPHMDHRAIVPVEGQMVLGETINRNVAGLDLNSKTYVDQNVSNDTDGNLFEDLAPYNVSRLVPSNEAPQIDIYKWWYGFNAILTRPVYRDSVRKEVDRHFTGRFWETLNHQAHKSLLLYRREPWTGVEYLITFVWPTTTNYGWRYLADIQEAAGINPYAYANYARYYGDWTTLRANWNLCREFHDFLVETMDWGMLCSSAREDWHETGLDMMASEPYGRLAYAYAAEQTGYPVDALKGKIGGARSMVTSVARLGLEAHIHTCTSEGDPWREFKTFNFFNELAMQLVRNKMGGIGWLNSSKGAMHELALAYKLWAPQAMNKEQRAIAKTGSNSLCDLTQRLFFGWDRDSLLEAAARPDRRMQPPSGGRIRWQSATDLYDMAVLCVGNIPVFLSDWAPAEYISGNYNDAKKSMDLVMQSRLGEPFTVRIYSQFQPEEITTNGKSSAGSWVYDLKTGWLNIKQEGNDVKKITIRFGKKVAPLHPYFTNLSN